MALGPLPGSSRARILELEAKVERLHREIDAHLRNLESAHGEVRRLRANAEGHRICEANMDAEVKRLRAETSQAYAAYRMEHSGRSVDLVQLQQSQAENKRLRAENAAVKQVAQRWEHYDDATTVTENVRAYQDWSDGEVRRLRAALERAPGPLTPAGSMLSVYTHWYGVIREGALRGSSDGV
jgi:chromosome segregation ATPase